MKLRWLALVISIIALVLVPAASACSLTDLPSCIVEGFFNFLLGILNAPIQVLLSGIKYLLAEPVIISMFQSFWALIIYIISIFYGLFLLYAGLNFMVSGYDVEKREAAKSMLQNIIIMIFLIQASYFIYSLMLEISALLTSGVINMIDPNFFLITADSLPNLGTEILLSAPYVLMLIFAIINLAFRYVLVSVGVIFFPIGLFFYFIPMLKGYGKLIINYILVMVFLPFFLALILLFSSKMIDIPVFANMKIVLMICAFAGVNLVFFGLSLYVIIKAATSFMHSDTGRLAIKAVKYFV